MSDTTPTPSPDTTLQLQDIQAAVRLLDIAVEKGTWTSWELFEAAYGVRNRLNAFVEAVAAIEAEKAKVAENTPTEVVNTTDQTTVE